MQNIKRKIIGFIAMIYFKNVTEEKDLRFYMTTKVCPKQIFTKKQQSFIKSFFLFKIKKIAF